MQDGINIGEFEYVCNEPDGHYYTEENEHGYWYHTYLEDDYHDGYYVSEDGHSRGQWNVTAGPNIEGVWEDEYGTTNGTWYEDPEDSFIRHVVISDV